MRTSSRRGLGHSETVQAIKRGIAATQDGRPAMLEFITTKEKVYSTFRGGYQ